jgi:hypothetical protein
MVSFVASASSREHDLWVPVSPQVVCTMTASSPSPVVHFLLPPPTRVLFRALGLLRDCFFGGPIGDPLISQDCGIQDKLLRLCCCLPDYNLPPIDLTFVTFVPPPTSLHRTQNMTSKGFLALRKFACPQHTHHRRPKSQRGCQPRLS